MIYFLRWERDDPHHPYLKPGQIKIGTTIRLSQRVKYITYELVRTGRHGERDPKIIPTVVAVTDGGRDEEQAIHARFANFRVHNEWFRPEPALLEFIKTECRPWDGVDEVPAPFPVKIDNDVMAEAITVAAIRGVSLEEYLSDVVRRTVESDLEREANRLAQFQRNRRRAAC